MDEKFKEFEKLCLPLIEYLHKKYDPHTTIIIDYDNARIVKDKMGLAFETGIAFKAED